MMFHMYICALQMSMMMMVSICKFSNNRRVQIFNCCDGHHFRGLYLEKMRYLKLTMLKANGMQWKRYGRRQQNKYVGGQKDHRGIVKHGGGMLAKAPSIWTDKLQRVLNAAARVITNTRKFDRGLTSILHDDLHWLDLPRCVIQDLCNGVQILARHGT